jgi:hypothetical protein
MGRIVPRLVDVDENLINKSNVALKLWKSHHQHSSFLPNGSLNIIDNGKIDSRCYKDAIIIYCIFIPISHESIIFNNIIMFHVHDETNKHCFKYNLNNYPKICCFSLIDLTCLIIISTTSCITSQTPLRFLTNLAWPTWLPRHLAHLHWGRLITHLLPPTLLVCTFKCCHKQM